MKRHGLFILQLRKRKRDFFGVENVLKTALKRMWFIILQLWEKKREDFCLRKRFEACP